VPADAQSVSAKKSGIDELFAEASKGVYRLYGAGRDGLPVLAEARADIVRRYLRGVRHVPYAQIVPCDPEVDQVPDAIPRVDLDVKSRPRRGLFGLLP
jgi:hypothetical protein